MKEKREKLKELVEKCFRNEATVEDRRVLSDTEEVQYCMEKQWKQAGTTIDKDKEERIWNKVKQSRKELADTKPRKIIYWRWATAACVVVLLTLGGVFGWIGEGSDKPMEYDEIYADECRTILLPDSSKVWLQEGSSLRYARNFSVHRDVQLKGDAVFEVNRQENNPFRVYINTAFVEVKGTVFRVNSRADHDEVTLFSGHVDLHTQSTGQVVSMLPNQRAFVDPEHEVTLTTVGCLKWEDGKYLFDDLQLDSLLGIINNMYDIHVIPDKGISLRSQFSGNIQFDDEPLTIIRKICYNLNLNYRVKDKKVIIYKNAVIDR